MASKLAYWITTVLIAAFSAFGAFAYLSGSPQAVQGFAHVGYPQQLRVILGVAKLLGAIALLVPGLAVLKEWAYAGFTFAWICAFFAHYLAGDGHEGVHAGRATGVACDLVRDASSQSQHCWSCCSLTTSC